MMDSKRNKNIIEKRRERMKRVRKQVTIPATGGAGGIHVASPRPKYLPPNNLPNSVDQGNNNDLHHRL